MQYIFYAWNIRRGMKPALNIENGRDLFSGYVDIVKFKEYNCYTF